MKQQLRIIAGWRRMHEKNSTDGIAESFDRAGDGLNSAIGLPMWINIQKKIIMNFCVGLFFVQIKAEM